MARYLFDIESDGLLDTISKVWIVALFNIDTKEERQYLEGDLGWIEEMSSATLLTGHNIINFDLCALKKMFKWEPSKTCNIHDTLLMSQSQNYKRFKSGRHRLDDWGEFLGDSKIDWRAHAIQLGLIEENSPDGAEFQQFHPAMTDYCIQDVRLNFKVYQYLLAEYREITAKNPSFKDSLRNEHAVAKFVSRCKENGWLVDRGAAENLLLEMYNQMKATEAIINPYLKVRTKAKDAKITQGEYPFKTPKFIKNGNYDAHTANWFFIPPECGQEEEDRLIVGPYSRIEFIQPDMSNMADVKKYLFSIGWQPDDFNRRKNEDGSYRITSPKLSEESLLALGEHGKIINDYTTTKSRYGILKGWLERMDDTNHLHGDCFTIATPTGRARHKTVANIPTPDAIWGKQMRSLLIANKGRKIVGCDSSGNQFRALCHYLKNDEYTKLVIDGDVHQDNANKLTDILREMKVYNSSEVVKRKTAKPFIYAFLFGAGGAKLSLIVLNKNMPDIGNKLKNEFIKRVPGLQPLVRKINEIYHKTESRGVAWIPGLDGRKIYCDSLHKSLNYLLQAFEAVSCKAAIAYFMKRMEEENIPYDPLLWNHDEFQVEVDEQYAEKTLEIGVEAYRESAKVFGCNILDGAGKIGNTLYETH
jgi:DNA polymerase I-like protein with 3'-5' exonuclease and polymerase domains